MKPVIFTSFIVLVLASCSTPKTYFTSSVRSKIEASNIPVTKLQYYVDRDVELRREVASGSAQVSAGVVKFENGKYVNIITLKKNTPGVCTRAYDDKMDISFEVGEGRYLTFGKLKRDSRAPYTLYADNWGRELGEIKYDGKTYYILPSGSEARLMIKKNALNTLKIEKREMQGRRVE
ncbi:hypothetical protein [Paraflavitalea speifideaquila]|uniref:hypothetical protein n=1 Tax=Paraflavitalea speifideaquila TaxID=3076558 RepID=UPI0028E883A8|nr:hypothetical protein [Paraflavitalea speifideiaquila]